MGVVLRSKIYSSTHLQPEGIPKSDLMVKLSLNTKSICMVY